MADVELPRGIALAWGIAADRSAAEREMSIERIVEAAIEIADADGMTAVSMSGLAARLGLHDDVALPVRVGPRTT